MNLKMQTRLIFFCVSVLVARASNELLVKLPDGYIMGRETSTFQNTTYFSFEGIPYAAPPVGNLRFKAPQPPPKWDGVLNNTYFRTACYQILQHYDVLPESEDCLYLNVHVPAIYSGDVGLLPVMVFFHGGGFITGMGFPYLPDFFIENVVFVTVNYRLGVFGFLSTQDDVIPGNNGLKDQLLAIKWINSNIKHFGGDPNKITIAGESAGSVSVAFQLLNQNSEGLFRGAILESGTFLSPFAIQRNARQIAYGTAALLEPELGKSNNTQSLLEILQTVDSFKLNAAAEQYYSLNSPLWENIATQGVMWGPVIEVENPDSFLTQKMYDQLKAGNILHVPIIIGFNSEESIYFNKDPDVVRDALSALDRNLSLLVPDNMQISNFDNRTEMGRLIREIYTGGENFADNIGAGIRYSSDNHYTRSVIKHAELYSKFADTYFYQFSYDGEIGGINIQYEGAEKVGHTEELRYLFCLQTSCDSTLPEADLLTRQRLVELWTNFVKYQNPTPEQSDLLENITWPKVYTGEGDFLYLDIGNNLEVRNHPKDETYKSWINLYNNLEVDSFDTY